MTELVDTPLFEVVDLTTKFLTAMAPGFYCRLNLDPGSPGCLIGPFETSAEAAADAHKLLRHIFKGSL